MLQRILIQLHDSHQHIYSTKITSFEILTLMEKLIMCTMVSIENKNTSKISY